MGLGRGCRGGSSSAAPPSPLHRNTSRRITGQVEEHPAVGLAVSRKQVDQLSQHGQLDFGVNGPSGFTDPFISVGPDGGSADQHAAGPIRSQH